MPVTGKGRSFLAWDGRRGGRVKRNKTSLLVQESLPLGAGRAVWNDWFFAGQSSSPTIFSNDFASTISAVAVAAVTAVTVTQFPNLLMTTLAPAPSLGNRVAISQPAKVQPPQVFAHSRPALLVQGAAAPNVLGEQRTESAVFRPQEGEDTSRGVLAMFSLPGHGSTESAPSVRQVSADTSRGVFIAPAVNTLLGEHRIEGVSFIPRLPADGTRGSLATFRLPGERRTESSASFVLPLNEDGTRGALVQIAPSLPIGRQQIDSFEDVRQLGADTSRGVLAQIAIALPPGSQNTDSAPYVLLLPDDTTRGYPADAGIPPPVVVEPPPSGGWPSFAGRTPKVPTVRDVPRETVEKIREVVKRDQKRLINASDEAKKRRIKAALDEEFRTQQQRLYLLVYLEVLNLELLRLQLEEEEAMFLMVVASQM